MITLAFLGTVWWSALMVVAGAVAALGFRPLIMKFLGANK
jgi:hypothetical protein